MPGGGQTVLVGLLDDGFRLTRCCLFYFYADNALSGPLVDFVPDLVIRNVVWPGGTLVSGYLDLILAAKCTEVRAGCEYARPDCLACLDQIPLSDYALGIKLAR